MNHLGLNKYLLLILLFMHLSCVKNKVNDLSIISYNKEIRKAFDYYKNDSLKRRALEFLVANMKYHYGNDANYINTVRN